MASKLRKGDQVIVLCGKSKGHVGEIIRVYTDGYVKVSGANLKKKCVKADPQNDIKGEIKTIEGRIHRSNVALYNADTKKKIKVGFKLEADKPKIRVDKATGEQV